MIWDSIRIFAESIDGMSGFFYQTTTFSDSILHSWTKLLPNIRSGDILLPDRHRFCQSSPMVLQLLGKTARAYTTGEDINSRPLAHDDQKIGWARKNQLLGAQAATRNRSFLFWWISDFLYISVHFGSFRVLGAPEETGRKWQRPFHSISWSIFGRYWIEFKAVFNFLKHIIW